MNNSLHVRVVALLALALAPGMHAATLAWRASSVVSTTSHSRSTRTAHATGTFDVKLVPQGTPDTAQGIALARMSIDKQFHGDLDATSKGEMLSSGTEANGSAAYVAIERLTGTLHGHSGSFVLMHSGTMTREAQRLTVSVAPGSGTGELAGIAGTMTIRIVEKKHYYDFEYALPETR